MRLAPILALLALGACATDEFARSAGEGAVEGALIGMDDPQARQKLARLLGSREVRAATRSLAAEAARGFVDGLRTRLDDETIERITDASSPAVERWVSIGAQAFVRELSRPQTEEQLGRIATNFSRSAGRAVTGGVAAEIGAQTGPQTERSLRGLLSGTSALLLMLVAIAAVVLVGVVFWAIRRFRRMHPRHVGAPTFGRGGLSREELRSELEALLRDRDQHARGRPPLEPPGTRH